MLLRITLFAALGGLLFGYDLGLIGPALQAFQTDEGNLSTLAYQAIVGAAKLGAFFGTFLGGALMLYYGRQPTIAIDSVFFVLGPALMAAFALVPTLVVGRLLVGLGVGVSAVVVPAYLGEIAPAKLRGRIVEVYELMVALGMVAAQLIDVLLTGVPGDWRWMVGAPIVPGLVLMLSLVLLPESPRWLVVQGRLDDALAVLHRIYNNERLPGGAQTSTADVEHELMLLWSGVEKEAAAGTARRRAVAEAKRGRKKGRARALAWPLARRRRFGRLDEESNGAEMAAQSVQLAGLPTRNGGSPSTQLLAGGAVGDAVRGEMEEVDLQGADGLESAGSAPSEPAALRAGDGEDAAFMPSIEAPPRDDGGDAGDAGGQDGSAHGVRRGEGGQNAASVTGREASVSKGVYGPGDGVPDLPMSASMSSAQSGTGLWGFLRTAAAMLWDVALVARGPERRAFWTALALAFFNQATASTAIINYAPKLLDDMGVEDDRISAALTVSISLSKLLGICGAMLLVDRWGRRALLMTGSAACTVCLALLAGASWASNVPLVVVAMDLFILGFSLSWAGVFWVLMSELFSMSSKSPATAATAAALFGSGAAVDLTFVSLNIALGGGAFLVYAGVAAASGVFVFACVPETKGKTLAEVQRLMGNAQVPASETVSAAPPSSVPSGGVAPRRNGERKVQLDANTSSEASAEPRGGGARMAGTARASLGWRRLLPSAAWLRRPTRFERMQEDDGSGGQQAAAPEGDRVPESVSAV